MRIESLPPARLEEAVELWRQTKACEAWLLERRVPKLNLMIRGDNAAARGFYAALGYESDDVIVLSHRLHQH